MSPDPAGRPRREEVLGVEVDVITRFELTERVVEAMLARQRLWVAHHNLHSAYLVLEDVAMRRWFDRADLVFVDGMALVAASRLHRGPLRPIHRATLLDWMPDVLDVAAREGRRVFHLGGDDAWLERGAAVWRQRHPGLELEVHPGFFDPRDSTRVVETINASGADLLLVGMGMPRQERWLGVHAASIEAPVVVTVGAFLGYAAGVTAEPPRSVGRLGFEWAWRLAADPRRLARRYLWEPFALLWALARR